MTRVAVIAVVLVIAHTGMVRVGLRLRMASQAVEYGIVGGVRVAIAACIGISVV